MSLTIIHSTHIGQVWGQVGPMLQRAIDIDPGEGSLDQLELLLRQGRSTLLVWSEDDETITGAATVVFHDAPKNRIAHATYMAGKGIVKEQVFKAAMDWMRANGATLAQCWCKSDLVPMYEKMGMTDKYHVMRIPL